MKSINRASRPFQLSNSSASCRSFTVQVEQGGIGLLAYLCQYALKEKSRTSVKQLLGDRYISVNGEATTRWDYMLAAGDVVQLNPSPLPTELHHKQVDIVWQDEHLILFHKGAGIPTVSSGEERDVTAMQVISKHLKKFNPQAKVYLLNRIDKDSSGFVLMAKSVTLQREITNHWDKYILQQSFVVLIEGQMPQNEGYLASPDLSNKTRVREREATIAGQARYRLLNNTNLGSLLRIELLSGRNNRLRKQFAQMSCPIMGDWRNGSKNKELGYVALDSLEFTFRHPITGKHYNFKQAVPGRFGRLLKP